MPQPTSGGVRLIFGKSIQSCLHYLEGCIHCCLLIAGNLFRQEVSNPHHARSTVLGERYGRRESSRSWPLSFGRCASFFAARSISRAKCRIRPSRSSEAIDRLGRRLSEVARLHDHLEFRGIAFHAVNIGHVTTMHVGLLGTMAQLYLSDLKEKTRRGQLGRALTGKIPGGKAYGYSLVEGNRVRDSSMKRRCSRTGASFANSPPASLPGQLPRVLTPNSSQVPTDDTGAIPPSGVKLSEAPASSTTVFTWDGSNGTAAPISRIQRPGSEWRGRIGKRIGRSWKFRSFVLSTMLSGKL